MLRKRLILRGAVPGLLLACFALPGCRKEDASAKNYALLSASDLAIGVRLGDKQADVEIVLGLPDQTKDKQRGMYLEAYYITRSPQNDPILAPPIPDLLGPQLKLTYVDGKLAQAYNAFQVDEEKPLLPPKIVEPLSGVKIGARRSDLRTVLGKPERHGEDQDEWRFSDGANLISIQILYRKVEKANADLAAALTISTHTASEGSRGEQYEKNKKARDAMHGG
jgi:hypothetical protein